MDSRIGLSPPPSLAALTAAGPIALFLDFDGTLVELAPRPDAIEPRPGLAERLARLGDRLDMRCALVSGRALSDIERHIGPLPIAAAGSHGTDIRDADGNTQGEVPSGLPPVIERELREFATEHDLDYEAKPHGGALHYRSNPACGDVARQFAETLALAHGWTAQHGKCVVELIANGANKGAAVFALMETAAFAGSRPFFIGDDLTDEAGFLACADLGGAGILVGDREPTRARYHLPDVASVHAWLDL
ncbi:trehalose-phosphatase [Erythrobacter sp. JK5]|uniref:trehalose-phosphatase n=1 Tax=Erythrobacter sp. JK5 TaxID=2829500 RepID=UPI001BA53647|nr:trehalose-phosphatase [Erythrobacter sp. JK5]QUL38968.1 trehalose-phosphatase [Erythrobacter sp. JK5]